MAGTVHIVGAGLAGLAAAVRLARSRTNAVVHEATAHPGGRCRSYFDRAVGMTIDNGNHLVLSANRAVLEFAQTIGSAGGLVGPAAADFAFVDLKSGERWTLRINDGLPWWIFDAARRVPGTSAADYFRLARLLFVRKDVPVCSTLACAGPLYERLVQPLLLAALNIDPREGSAALASTIVRETLLRGGRACRPLVAREGLSGVFIEPALKHLRERNVGVRLEHELRGLRMAGDEIEALDFGADAIRLGRTDAVILAVPAHAAAGIVPGLQTPQGYRAIANAHFRIAAPAHLPPMIGVINGTVEWIFTFKDRLSVTISSADRLLDQPRQELAQALWREVSAVTGVAGELPPWQVVRERRATFAATPAENARRPGARTPWRNLFLAGDWTATGLPATLESAVRSGNRAAELAGAVAGVTT
jgi:squalene-associated FAD-dependent desaturase